eukprot:4345339-Amphidinium_carterae.1
MSTTPKASSTFCAAWSTNRSAQAESCAAIQVKAQRQGQKLGEMMDPVMVLVVLSGRKHYFLDKCEVLYPSPAPKPFQTTKNTPNGSPHDTIWVQQKPAKHTATTMSTTTALFCWYARPALYL